MCIPRIWLRRVIEAEPFEVWGGKPRRDLLYVDDAAEAVLYAVVTREAGGLALNVGREEPCADLAEAIIMAHAGREIRDRNFRRSASASISATLYTTIADFAQSPAGRVRLADGLRRSLDYIVGIWRATCRGSWSGTPCPPLWDLPSWRHPEQNRSFMSRTSGTEHYGLPSITADRSCGEVERGEEIPRGLIVARRDAAVCLS